jgi:DNA repair exonuclease SbcCD nuclease subunit
MSAVRIVHCSDVHLETVFPDTRGGAARRRALEDAFVRIVDLAIAREADLLTIGGDLYEAERFGPQAVRFLFEQFTRFGKPVFVAPGNHDPHVPTSPLARADLPANVRVFNEAAWREYPLSDTVSLYGFGHTPAEPGRPFAGAKFERGDVRIALVHGSDEERCPPGKRATAPFTKAEVLAAGATVLLTGHYHGGYIVRDGGKPIIVYGGSPEPIKFGEADVHGAAFITIENGKVTAELVPIAKTRLIEASCDVSESTTDREMLAKIDATLAPYGANDYVRLRVFGSVLPGMRIDCDDLVSRCGATLGSLEIVDATVAHDYAAIAREPTVRGHVVRDLLALGDEGRAALRYALAAFDGTEIAP